MAKRDIATAGTIVRMNYSSNNRKDLMSRLSGTQTKQGGGGSLSVEPGFRIYGSNKAAREFSEILKPKQKGRLASINASVD